MQPLSTEARARLAAFRSAESPDRAIADRCLAALEQRLHSGDDRLADPPRRLAAPLAVAVALAAAVVLALGWAVTGGLSAPRDDMAAPYHSDHDPQEQHALRRTPDPTPRAQARTAVPKTSPPAEFVPDEPVPEELIPEPPTAELPPPELPAAELPAADQPAPSDTSAASDPPVPSDISDRPVPADTPAADAPPVLPTTSKPARQPIRSADAVAAEVALLRRAKLSEPHSRLALLKEHARKFPSGLLTAERELLVIETRCELNEVERARMLAEKFMRRFRGSPLVERAATICGGPDSAP